MLMDHISNIFLYAGLNPRLVKALDFISRGSYLSLSPGEHEIDGRDIYAIVSDYYTKDINAGQWEAHNAYADIHVMIEGEEKLGFTCRKQQKVMIDYDVEKDILFLEDKNIMPNFIDLQPGWFLLFTPEDAHMPGLMTGESKKVRKMVVKVLFGDYF